MANFFSFLPHIVIVFKVVFKALHHCASHHKTQYCVFSCLVTAECLIETLSVCVLFLLLRCFSWDASSPLKLKLVVTSAFSLLAKTQ